MRLTIVMVASEAQPYAKTGGLGEVMGDLPRAVAALGHDVSLFVPLHRGMRERFRPVPGLAPITVRMHDGIEEAELLTAADAPGDVSIYAIGADAYFDRPHLYGEGSADYADNARRFSFFCRAFLAALSRLELEPDVIHCHDWQSALVPVYLRGGIVGNDEAARAATRLQRAGVVFTVHNLGYQGLFPASDFAPTGLPRTLFAFDGLEFHGRLNFLKGALLFADRITTVSPRYAREIRLPEQGSGLDGILESRSAELTGILNGIDDVVWNPAADPHLVAPYDSHDLRGKRRCKADLLLEMELEGELDTPIAAVISRLAAQKGFEILLPALPALIERGLRVVVLGAGEPRIAAALRELAEREKGRLVFRTEWDDALEHKIQAGADLLLMPSRYEPCGLIQMISLRYGTVPVVRATGGLVDTVLDAATVPEQGTGFWIDQHSEEALIEAVDRALAVHRDTPRWQALVRRAMVRDFSWGHAARRYAQLYRRISLRPRSEGPKRTRIPLGPWGFRARLGEGFDRDAVCAVAQGLALHLLDDEDSPALAQRGVIVAADTRFLSDDFAAQAAGVLAANDLPAHWCEAPPPLPAVAHAIVECGLAGGLVVTAGAASRRWNGVYLLGPWGGPLEPEMHASVEERANAWAERDRAPEAFTQSEARQFGLWRDEEPMTSYRAALARLIDSDTIRTSGLRVAVDVLWGTARGTLDRMLDGWGVCAEVVHAEPDPSFGGIRPEPSATSLADLAQRVTAGHHDLGIATDPSGCLLGAVDRDGSVVFADHLLALVLDHLAETRSEQARRIGRSVGVSHLLDAVAGMHGLGVVEAPGGFQQLALLLHRGEIGLGADESGACALRAHVPHPDAILIGLLVVEMVARRRQSLRTQLEDLFRKVGRRHLKRRDLRLPDAASLLLNPEAFPDRLGEFPVRDRVSLDGIKLLFDEDRWVLVRPLGVVSGLHFLAEATSESEATTLLDLAEQIFVRRT